MKIGDKVTIRNDLCGDQIFPVLVTEEMEEYRGMLATITHIDKEVWTYSLDIDNGKNEWTSGMFEPAPGETLYKKGDRIIIRSDLRPGNDFKMHINSYMVRHFGKEAGVKQVVYNDRYRLSVDDQSWVWTNDMLIPYRDTITPDTFYESTLIEC